MFSLLGILHQNRKMSYAGAIGMTKFNVSLMNEGLQTVNPSEMTNRQRKA
jgi:hypothetical protein